MKPQLRQFAQTITPGLFHWYRSYCLRARFRAQFGSDQRLFKPVFYPGNAIPTVLTGCFRGMSYIDEIVWGPITPKWAGTYEMELSDVIGEIIIGGYDRIVNLGCAEGYYAVGLALQNDNFEVFAFDLDPLARRQARRLAILNQVAHRICVGATCTHSKLNDLINGKTLVVADIEGYEVALLDPVKAPRLNEADLLIEVHEDAHSGGMQMAQERLTTRFASSHTVQRRTSHDREDWMAEHHALWQGKISRERMAKALEEGRSVPQIWLWAKTR
jgi:hypothetical protein